ncbi:HAD family phosphatase [Candidatus Woesearchaeota archaeon]|nr:HAD family phosphatase [Candidatus Woesearchaeota archaeon]
MIKAIIFDFDGVVVDTEAVKFEHLSNVLVEKGFSTKDLTLKSLIGKKTRHFLQEIFPEITEKEINQIYLERSKLHKEQQEKYILIEGLVDLLKFLKKSNFTIALCTGSENQLVESVLKHNKIEKYFETIVTGEDFSSSKPDPECYEKTLEKLNLNTKDVIIIEDSPAGIIAGKAVGASVFGLMTYLNESELKDADKVFKSHVDLLDFFKKAFMSE